MRDSFARLTILDAMASTEPNAETAKDHIALISVEKIISRLISQALFLLEEKKKAADRSSRPPLR